MQCLTNNTHGFRFVKVKRKSLILESQKKLTRSTSYSVSVVSQMSRLSPFVARRGKFRAESVESVDASTNCTYNQRERATLSS